MRFGGASRTLVVDEDDAPIPLADDYEYVGANATDQVCGGVGAVGDILTRLIFCPTATNAGDCYIKDGGGGAKQVFKTGTLADLKPWVLEFGIASTDGGWKITTGAAMQVVAVGQFT